MTDLHKVPADVAKRWRDSEKWAKELGVTMVDVWFYAKRKWTLEPQVEDDDTFLVTITMAFSRLGASYALWFDGEKWTLLSRAGGDAKRYPSRSAAEMVAIHRAR